MQVLYEEIKLIIKKKLEMLTEMFKLQYLND